MMASLRFQTVYTDATIPNQFWTANTRRLAVALAISVPPAVNAHGYEERSSGNSAIDSLLNYPQLIGPKYFTTGVAIGDPRYGSVKVDIGPSQPLSANTTIPMEVQALRTDVDAIRREIHTLHTLIAAAGASFEEPDRLAEIDRISGILADFDVMSAGDDEATALDLAADYGLRSDIVSAAAERALAGQSAYLRTSAARALAVSNPSRAREVLPNMIQEDANPTARSIVAAALAAIA